MYSLILIITATKPDERLSGEGHDKVETSKNNLQHINTWRVYRTLSWHSGGVILGEQPLWKFTGAVRKMYQVASKQL